jgi:hypothetical protein
MTEDRSPAESDLIGLEPDFIRRLRLKTILCGLSTRHAYQTRTERCHESDCIGLEPDFIGPSRRLVWR